MTKQLAQPVVLVVDDEAPIRVAARRILEAGGYKVLEAENGARAIELLTDDVNIDLLMADLEMPELTGEEMARRLRAQRQDLRVLYVSGYVDRLLNTRPILWEGEAFLEKPFTFDGLSEAVSLLLFGTLKPPVR
jgi:two-component system, cell cycle sensor histidine kinase and response regulator CckA